MSMDLWCVIGRTEWTSDYDKFYARVNPIKPTEYQLDQAQSL